MKKIFTLLVILLFCVNPLIINSQLTHSLSVFNPRPILRQNSDTGINKTGAIYFQEDELIYTRSIETGEILHNWKTDRSQAKIANDDICFQRIGSTIKRFYPDGEVREYIFENISAGENIYWINDEPYRIKREWIGDDYQIALCGGYPLKELWKISVGKQETTSISFDNKYNFWIKDVKEKKTQLLDTKTGSVKFVLSGIYDIVGINEEISYLYPMDTNAEKAIVLVNTKLNSIIYKEIEPGVNKIYDNGNSIVILKPFYKDNYKPGFNDGYKCKLFRINNEGKEIENYTFDLPGSMRPFENLWDISTINNSFVFAWCFNPSRLVAIDYKSNRVVLEKNMYSANVLSYGNIFIVHSFDSLLSIDSNKISTLWEIKDAPLKQSKKTVNNIEYHCAQIWDKNNDCFALKLKLFNKNTQKTEPFEYLVSPDPGFIDSFLPTPFGMLFIPISEQSDKAIKSLQLIRPGVDTPVYKYTNSNLIFSNWEQTEKPNVIKLNTREEKIYYILDIETGNLRYEIIED